MKNDSGQSMFELLIAVFVIAVTLTALLGLVTNSIGNTTFSKDRTNASKYTQEAVEWLRSERDNNWGQFIARGSASGTCYSMQSLSWTGGGCGGTQFIPNTNLRRQVTLIYNSSSPNLVEVRVVTSWNDSSGAHESRITTYFTNWRTR